MNSNRIQQAIQAALSQNRGVDFIEGVRWADENPDYDLKNSTHLFPYLITKIKRREFKLAHALKFFLDHFTLWQNGSTKIHQHQDLELLKEAYRDWEQDFNESPASEAVAHLTPETPILADSPTTDPGQLADTAAKGPTIGDTEPIKKPSQSTE